MNRGPCVQVSVGLGRAFAESLVNQGQPVPSARERIRSNRYGATSTCIDADLAARLKLPVIDVCKMASASHSESEQNVHPAMIEVLGVSLVFDAPRAIGCACLTGDYCLDRT